MPRTTARRRRRGPHLWAVLCLVPSLVAILAFDFWPLLRTFFLSTQTTNLFGEPAGFIGLRNFEAMFASGSFWTTLGLTLIFTAGSVSAKLVVGLAIALPLSQRLAGTGVFRSAVLIPMAVSVAVAGLAFRAVMAPSVGLLDQIAAVFGQDPVGWLTSPRVAMISVIAVDTWTAIGFTTLLLLAALDNIGGDVREAAAIDGATGWRSLKDITLPLITPTLFFILVTQSIQGFREFTVINVLTKGGPAGATNTLVLDIYANAFGGTADYGAASARSVVLLILIVILSLVQFRVLERRVNY